MNSHSFLLFQTDLFVFRQRDEDIDAWSVGGDCAGWFYVRLLLAGNIQRHADPAMEDWGWTFVVLIDGVRIRVNVWAYETENCWLFGLEPVNGWFRRQSTEKLSSAKMAVARALDSILASDARFQKRAWFAESPFDLNTKGF